MYPITLVLHGGAGTIRRSKMTPEKEQQYRQALQDALGAGFAILENGGRAIEAVERAVLELENCPLFNAGRGSVFTAAGDHEMDAAIMEGRDLQAGAVALIKTVKNPISLARLVMEKSGHVMLAGEGAEQFAVEQGCERATPEYFFDDFRHRQWLKIKGTEAVQLDHTEEKDRKFCTVGAVALDQFGDLAAATSTGGLTNKRYGRIGDSPVIGSGTYANNATCAISCTGSGEFFIRAVTAYDVSCLMEYKGLSLAEASRKVVQERLVQIGGDGGLIGVDRKGNYVMEFNSEGMYRAVQTANHFAIDIYGEENA